MGFFPTIAYDMEMRMGMEHLKLHNIILQHYNYTVYNIAHSIIIQILTKSG
jgi:hypothetical protein